MRRYTHPTRPGPLHPEEKAIVDDAKDFARKHKTSIARDCTDPNRFPTEERPVSVFMAGSPGAGKTEASIELLSEFDEETIIRIDPDELRELFPGYTGGNANLFQGAVSDVVNRILDLALKQGQSFLLDGTLTNYKIAEANVARALDKNRVVQILYVYQDPRLAWEFVQAREAAEGRRISRETFIEQYFAAREVVNTLKRKFGKDLKVDLLMKNLDNSRRWYKAGVDQIDNHIPERYSRDELYQVLPQDPT